MTQVEEFYEITESVRGETLSFEAERNLVLAIIAKNLAVIADELAKLNKDK